MSLILVVEDEHDMAALVEDLFTLARAEAQQLPLNLEAVDARAVVGHLAETLAPLALRERQIEIVTALPADLPPVRADRVRLEQVVLNLLQNALRYTLPGGIIAVEGSADDGVVTLAVDDTGVGIPSEELPLVFERFYRSDSSRARESGGAGIGLALVSELTAAMGGRVAVESTPGRGSRFSIALPQAT
jgi:signal transduction histidine kinase